MILNTWTRTDIPAFFSEWFYNRVKQWYVLVRNPYFPEKISKYIITTEVVECIAFCTKNPAPMLARLDEIKDFWQFWFVSINPYWKEVEPFVPPTDKVINSFIELSNKIWKQKVSWRYDPIFINETYTIQKHIESFEYIASKLANHTLECVISFIDLYEKTKKNFPWVKSVSQADRLTIWKEFKKICDKYNIELKTCVEWTDLAQFWIDCSWCMTKPIIERAIWYELELKVKKSKRWVCDCLIWNDIWAYNTCLHGCLYCYANADFNKVKENFKNHNPNSAFLIN